MYKLLIRPVLFLFDPEKIHHAVFSLLGILFAIPGLKFLFGFFYRVKSKKFERDVFGLKFPNPIGLAAGFDKDGILNENWEYLGFGFVELGTVTPRPQPGNPKPRLFRLPLDHALINRMGFNSGGVEAMVKRLKKIRKKGIIIGGNIGKNKETPNEKALNDYLLCFDALFSYVDYFTVNVSSPNTPGLRELQEKEPLKKLLAGIQEKNLAMKNPKPVLLKIATDLTETQLDDILEIIRETGLAGLVATNTTLSREHLQTPESMLTEVGAGGLSGAPITSKSLAFINMIHTKTGGKIPLIAVGGIMNADDAKAMLDSGASLVQVYTGFIYEGPGMLKKIMRQLN